MTDKPVLQWRKLQRSTNVELPISRWSPWRDVTDYATTRLTGDYKVRIKPVPPVAEYYRHTVTGIVYRASFLSITRDPMIYFEPVSVLPWDAADEDA